MPPSVRALFNVGTILSGVVAAIFMWLPTHSLGESLLSAVLMMGLITLLRLADPLLTPVWTAMRRIPRFVLVALAVVLPAWYASSRMGASTAGKEVSVARQTLLVATLLAYVLLRPLKNPKEATSDADATGS